MANGASREFQDALQSRIREQNVELSNFRVQFRRLNEEREIARHKYGRNVFVRRRRQVGWRRELRDSGYTRDLSELIPIWKTACRQYNMSSKRQKHGLIYVPPNDEALEVEPTVADPTAGFQPGRFCDISLLNHHPKIIFKIAAYTMVKHNPISLVARFDIHDVYPPTQGGVDKRTGLSIRLHWGGRTCAINSSPLPNDVLSPLYVCRDWYEIFGSAFYVMNKFHFESFGEFGIFSRMTSRASRQRIREIDITWIGSRMEKSDPNNTGQQWDRSRWGLHRFGEFLNLGSLVINIDEGSTGRLRRKNEPNGMKRPLKNSTETHDNNRMNRDLRKLRGIDNVYQLRGIKHIELNDYSQEFPQTPVRDQSFVQDLRNQVCSPKSIDDKAKAKRKNLTPMLRRRKGTIQYKPSRQVKDVLKLIHKSRPRYPRPQFPREMDDDSDSDDSDDSDDEDPGDISDSDDDVDYEQLDNDAQSQSDDSDSDSEDDDDAPDHSANALGAASTVSRAGNFGHSGGNNHNGNNDDDDEMDGLGQNNATKPDGDSDDGLEPIQSEKPAEVKVEDDDDLAIIGFAEAPEVEFIRCVKRPNYIDLTQLPDMEDPDTVFPSVEEDEVKEEVKEEDPAGAGSMDAMESIPVFVGRLGPRREASSPFGHLSLRRRRTDQSSLFVRQSPSSRRSFSSHFLASFGRPSYERKRSIDGNDDDDDDVVARASSRRRLSSKEVDD
ncbi:hypothetical protein V494_06521 [Pseudogymnoascus sp. VKM F-4513 (FW-928)]|nr:hypothetical protein V494_06521 [Pseudogymnoascus sp. VKM F-4513 (FW-928)]